MPACIIPVGPEWQNPPGQRNGRPEIVSIMPPAGSIVTNPIFRVIVSDPDGDDLVVRWMADVPPFTDAFVTPSMPLPGAPAGTPVAAEFMFDCLQLKSGRPTHQIMVAISDSAFTSETDPLATDRGPAQIQLLWTLEKSCQAQQR